MVGILRESIKASPMKYILVENLKTEYNQSFRSKF